MVSSQAFVDKEFAKGLDYSGITFPVTIKQIPQIERQNKININVSGYEKENQSILSMCQKKDMEIILSYYILKTRAEKEVSIMSTLKILVD